MCFQSTRPAPCVATALVGAAFLALAAVAGAQAPIVQPGAPGEPSREITAAEASDLAGIRFTEADVRFMQGMIPHHAQALEMTGARRRADGGRDDAAPGAAHRALAGRRDRDDAGVAARPRAGRPGRRRAPRPRLGADAGDAHPGGDGPACRGRGSRVRPALPRADDQAPPGRRDDGRQPPRPARRGAGFPALRVHERRHVRPDGGDRSHGRDARRALARSARGSRGRVRRRRPGAVEHGSRRHAGEARGLLRSPQPGGAAGTGRAGRRAGEPAPAELPRRARHGAQRRTRRRRRRGRGARSGSDGDDAGERGCDGRRARRGAGRRGGHAGAARAAQLRQHRPRLRRRSPLRRQPPRLQHLSCRGSGVAAARELRRLPRRAGRRVGGRQPADHVGRADARAGRLRPAGRRRAGERGALPRRPRLRHRRPADAAAGGGRADLPRLAHPYRGHGPGRRRQHLRLQFGRRPRPFRRGARRLLGRVAGRGRRTPHASASTSSASRSPTRRTRASSAVPPSSRIPTRATSRGCGAAATTGRARSGRPSRAAATTSPPSPRSASPPEPAPGTASCSTSPTR